MNYVKKALVKEEINRSRKWPQSNAYSRQNRFSPVLLQIITDISWTVVQ